MRLKKDEINVLKESLKRIAKDAKLYLFGSRVDDTKKGGDIDILIVSDKLSKQDLRVIRMDFHKKFGEQKIDILLDNGSFGDPFHKYIFQKAVLL
jgi:predicted nucleotidyltransferase